MYIFRFLNTPLGGGRGGGGNTDVCPGRQIPSRRHWVRIVQGTNSQRYEKSRYQRYSLANSKMDSAEKSTLEKLVCQL